MSDAAGPAADPAPLDLREQQLLRRARAGEPHALGALWDGCVDELWSVAVGLLGPDPALDLLGGLREQVRDRAPGLALDRSFRIQALELLWAALREGRGVRALGDVAEAPAPPTQLTLTQGLAALPLELRWVYLLAFLCGLHSAEIAALSESDEATVRALRARAAWALVASTQGAP